MPVSKSKPTTATPEIATSRATSPTLPEQEDFRQHLRRLAVSAVQVLIEQVMCEELETCLGASWGEYTPTRRGYQNGFYTRDLVTSTGRIEDLKVPRDREGKFHSQVFERYNRYEPEVAEALTQMFVSGVSTQKVGEIAQTLIGVAPSASAVSRLNQTLTEQYQAWRERPLLAHYRVIYLDGIHFTVRHGEQTDATMILTALGVDLEGSREVLASRASAEESKEGWCALLQDLRTRGVERIDLLVTDGHEGLLAAVAELFPTILRQRCLVHKHRNVMSAIPKTRAARGECRTRRDLVPRDQRRGPPASGCLQSQISETVSRSDLQSLRRRRAFIDLLCFSAGHASLYSQHECH
jgi:putative transposase